MIRTRIAAALLIIAGSAEAQQATQVPSASPPSVSPAIPRVPIPSVYGAGPFERVFRERGSLRNGINSAYLPPQAIFYIDSYQKAEQTSRCLVAADGISASASSFWAARPNSQPERRSLADWARRAQGCYDAGLAVPRSLLRGALAEAQLERDGFIRALSAPTSKQLTAFFAAEANRRRASNGADQTLSAFASCVAPLAQAQISPLLATRHGSREERIELNRVLANGASCIAGDWHLPKASGTSFLRAYLAEASFRWNEFTKA